jgi:DNA-binding CsgD family transcriptional regulator
MDHVRILSSLVSLFLSLLALVLIIALSKRKRMPLSRFVLLLVITHIAYECYAFTVYYVDVNITGIFQAPDSVIYKLIWIVKAIILLAFRALLIKISAILLGIKLPFKLRRWLGAVVAGLIAFLAAWIAFPDLHAQFAVANTAFRISLAVIELATMIIVLLGSRSCADHFKRRLLGSFALLHLLELVFFAITWVTILKNLQPSLPLRLAIESLYPIYFNAILPIWLWLFFRPWLAHTASLQAAAGRAANLDGMGLSGREQEILSLILLGKSNQDIAEKMFISGHTIKNTITTIYAKLGVANRKELFHRFLSGNPKSGR